MSHTTIERTKTHEHVMSWWQHEFVVLPRLGTHSDYYDEKRLQSAVNYIFAQRNLHQPPRLADTRHTAAVRIHLVAFRRKILFKSVPPVNRDHSIIA